MQVIRWMAACLLCAACAAVPGASAASLLVDPFVQPGPVVLIFVRSDCPIANRYAPTIRGLAQEHAAHFVLVYPDSDATAEVIAAHRGDYSLPLDALRDPEHAWVARSGVSMTPEVAVYDAQRRLVYRGRIDDRFPEPGIARAQAQVQDLDRVLDALERGEAPVFSSTPAIGCPIPELKAR